MAKKSRMTRSRTQVRNSLRELVIGAIREFSPGSTQRLINSSIELMEAQREFLAERIARLEQVRGRLSQSGRQTSRAVRVRARKRSRSRAA